MAERILVIMPNWFGETLFATPFLSALRRARPSAFIAALGVARCRDVLAHHPQIDEFVQYDERASWAGKLRLARELRAKRFDTAFLLRKSLTRSLVLRAAGIPRRIGFAHWKTRWMMTETVPRASASIHKASTYLRLLAPLGVQGALADGCVFTVSSAERAEAAELLKQAGVERPFVVLHPGANWAHKQWPPERFAQVANALASTHQVVVSGAPEDRALVGIIRDRMATPLIILAGRTTLRQLAACLERAALVITNDTGILHIACALSRPVVALYGPTSPTVTGPLGDPARTAVIHHPESCPRIPCLQPSHPGFPGMSAITVEEVLAVARHLLGVGHEAAK